MDPGRLSDPSIRRPPAALTLRPGFDLAMARVDLVRATHREIRSVYMNGRIETSSSTEPNPYSDLVVVLGNGIVVDYNGNLCVDILRLYGLDESDRLKVVTREKTPFEGFDTTATFVRKGKAFELRRGPKERLEASLEGSSLMVKTRKSIFWDSHTLTLGEGRIESSALGYFGEKVNQMGSLVGQDRLELKGFWKDVAFTMPEPDHIELASYFVMEREGDGLRITLTGLFGISKFFTIYRTDSGIIFFDQDNRGVECLKEGSTVKVIENGVHTASFEISVPD